jgi:hypothetical protein
MQPNSSEGKSRILLPILLGSLVLIALYLSLSSYYANYFPFADDPAISEGWNRGVTRWFTEGISDMLMPYPEWSVPVTDFMRPGYSLFYRLEQLAFGSNYSVRFVFYYLIQFAGLVLLVLTGRHFGLPRRWLIFLSLVIAINPEFTDPSGLTWLSGQIDLPVGVLSLLSFYLLCLGRYGAAVASLAAAVFTKETALIWPVAACVSTYVTTRRKTLSLVLLSPAPAWFLVRGLVFKGHLSSNYAVPMEPRGLALQVLKGILQWPTGMIGRDGARVIFTTGSVRGHETDAILLLFNLFLWVSLLYVAWLTLGPLEQGAQRRRILPLVIWTLGALGFGLLGAKPRYGASIYVFEILLFVVVCNCGPDRRARVLAYTSLAMLTAAFVWQFQLNIKAVNPDAPHSMRELVLALKRNDGPGKVAYVVNSASSYASPFYITRFAEVQTRLVILNEFEGCVRASQGSTSIAIEGTRARIESSLPDCATFYFSQVPSKKLTGALGGTLVRGSFATYTLPAGFVSGTSIRSREPIVDFGRQIGITLAPEDAGGYFILSYNWQTGAYDCTGPGCRS